MESGYFRNFNWSAFLLSVLISFISPLLVCSAIFIFLNANIQRSSELMHNNCIKSVLAGNYF